MFYLVLLYKFLITNGRGIVFGRQCLRSHFEDQIFAEWTAHGPLVDQFWMQINK